MNNCAGGQILPDRQKTDQTAPMIMVSRARAHIESAATNLRESNRVMVNDVMVNDGERDWR